MSAPVVIAAQSVGIPVTFAWLEITRNCQMTCEHCYTASRPGLGHGSMSVSDWKRTMQSLRSLGVRDVQFIGGEPTGHPAFCELVNYAATQGFSIEVYSNLVGITEKMWDCFLHNKVSLATSFYSFDSLVHDAVTSFRGSHKKTAANIRKAIQLGLGVRTAIIDVRDDQNIEETTRFLQNLGMDPTRISSDRVRGVGRGINSSQEDAKSALCGKCTSGVCVITSEGSVYPCIMARSFELGNVIDHDIADIFKGDTFKATIEALNAAFSDRKLANSDDCGPLTPCTPKCSPSCSPDPNCKPTSPLPCTPHIAHEQARSESNLARALS